MVDLDEWIFLIIALLCRISELLAATVHRSVREKSMNGMGGWRNSVEIEIESSISIVSWMFCVFKMESLYVNIPVVATPNISVHSLKRNEEVQHYHGTSSYIYSVLVVERRIENETNPVVHVIN
ncbi:hypothetical protein CDAR_501691 [Caerostris darwini]|uniref:Uncharacterized protein n=1 Tax=Caerostris darwini TaxID=1538125 RepID=A0AAV4TT81_9ARAC|nr:hypothetical protein CDAR_501691 [Caerostris darwini]